MSKTILTGGIAALTLVATGAYGADTDQNMVAKGNWLGSIAASVSTTNSTTTTTTSLTVGNMVTNNVGLGVKLAYSSVDSTNTFTGFLSARYYFDPQPNKTLIPFIGPFVGYSKPSGGVETTIYGGNAGFEYFVAKNVSLTPSVNFYHTDGTGISTDTWSFAFGLTFWFAGK